MSNAREWARRAALSALAGTGLTAAGVGGPLAGGGALAAEPPAGTPAPGQPPTSTTPAASGAEQGTTTAATTTAPVAAPTPAQSSAAPAPVPTATTQQPSTKQTAGGSHDAHHGPTVVHQHTQPPSTGGTSFKPAALPPAPSLPSGPQRPAEPAVVPSSNIAPPPQLAAGQLPSSSLLSGSLVSMQALGFYRIPLFLLPIYQAAATQYGVPWQILAAINEVETDYGTDLSVSSAGALGWMQFMPETWLQYGVDAVNAGYADPYNPVDAIFAAARYLHAAGASSDLHGAILAYNHSEAYLQSVLLRARLIASYPASVIATLTGLTEGSLPAAGARLTVSPGPSDAPAAGSSSATAGTVAVGQGANAPAPPSQLSELLAAANAPVVAVEDGRIVGMGRSRKLGRYLVLRDTYGDVFTYAGLGSIVPSFRLPKPAPLRVPKGALHSGEAEKGSTSTGAVGGGRPGTQTAAAAQQGSQGAGAGSKSAPLTLHVAAKQAPKDAPSARTVQVPAPPRPPAAPGGLGGGKVRVFAHPGNLDAVAAIRAHASRTKTPPLGWTALTRGALVTQGTVLGRLSVLGDGAFPGSGQGSVSGSGSSAVQGASAGPATSAAQAASGQVPRYGYMRFAIRPPGSQSAIDPGPVLANWRQLDAALHPQGGHAGAVLAGATATDAFLLGGGELERAVLADPRIRMGACDRHQVAAGKVDERALALLVFLSRSGLGPTVAELACRPAGAPAVHRTAGQVVKITAINEMPIAAHQGAGTITDIAIRTLLTAKHGFAPAQILSLMQYPGAPSTIASADHASYLELRLPPKPRPRALQARASTSALAAHATAAGVSVNVTLDSGQWHRLITRIGGLPQPKVARKPSGAAIRD